MWLTSAAACGCINIGWRAEARRGNRRSRCFKEAGRSVSGINSLVPLHSRRLCECSRRLRKNKKNKNGPLHADNTNANSQKYSLEDSPVDKLGPRPWIFNQPVHETRADKLFISPGGEWRRALDLICIAVKKKNTKKNNSATFLNSESGTKTRSDTQLWLWLQLLPLFSSPSVSEIERVPISYSASASFMTWNIPRDTLVLLKMCVSFVTATVLCPAKQPRSREEGRVAEDF